MDISNKSQCIYVDIDALLDTRLASLHLIHPSLVDEALKNNYFIRLEDSFKSVNKHDFAEVYKTRDYEVLKASTYTKILPLLQDAVRKLLHQALDTPHTTDVAIVVNVYPYKLNDNEMNELKEVIIHYTGNLCEVEIINVGEEDLTPNYCDKFTLLIKYEYEKWLDYQAKTKALEKKVMATTVLMVPRLFFTRLPTPQEVQEFKRKKQDIFKDLEILFSPVISLKVLPIDMFCVDIGENK